MINKINRPSSLNQPVGTVLDQIIGPLTASLVKLRRNAYVALADDTNPKYSLTVTGLGTARLEGTADVTITASGGGGSGSPSGNKPYAYDPAPAAGAVWTTIMTQAGAGTNNSVVLTTGANDYAFVRLVIVATGVGEANATIVWD